jgi:polyisoprenoid-binding protein YceI
VLLGQKNTAVGRTTDVTGRIVIKGTTVDSGSFTANMKTVHSDQKQRDGQFQGKIMDTSTYPTATFTLTSPVQLGTPPASGATMAATAKGNLTLRGTTRPVVIQLTAEHVGTSLEVLGNLDVVFADWKIPQPSFPGVAVVQNHGTLEFLLQFIRGSVQPTTAQAPTTTALANGAYRACLAQHGVTIPAPGGPGGPPNPGAGGPSGAFGAGGPPGGPGGGQQSPQVQAARLACRSLAPAGGPGQIVVSPTTVAPLQLGAG